MKRPSSESRRKEEARRQDLAKLLDPTTSVVKNAMGSVTVGGGLTPTPDGQLRTKGRIRAPEEVDYLPAAYVEAPFFPIAWASSDRIEPFQNGDRHYLARRYTGDHHDAGFRLAAKTRRAESHAAQRRAW